MALKVLFLDIDGVLNSTRSFIAFGGYPQKVEHLVVAGDVIAVRLLQRLCDSAGISVVLSSAWRTSYTFASVGEALGLPIIGATPVFATDIRGEEIAAWLVANPPVESYVIVDDHNDMLPEQQSRLVLTSGHDGLTWAKYSELCNLFGESAYAGSPRDRHWRDAGDQPAGVLLWGDDFDKF